MICGSLWHTSLGSWATRWLRPATTIFALVWTQLRVDGDRLAGGSRVTRCHVGLNAIYLMGTRLFGWAAGAPVPLTAISWLRRDAD